MVSALDHKTMPFTLVLADGRKIFAEVEDERARVVVEGRAALVLARPERHVFTAIDGFEEGLPPETLLPLLALFWHVKTGVAGPQGAAASWFPFSAILQNGQPLTYPLATWRVDAVVLVVLGFAMLPVSLGRWELGRWEGAGLILGYAMYLILEAAVTVRL